MADSFEECLRITTKAVVEDPAAVALRMGLLIGEERAAYLDATARAREALGRCRESLSPDNAQEIAGVLLLVKAQNDILAGHLLLWSGYNRRAIYFIRLALESIAQCILVVLDAEYYAFFKADTCRADKAIAKLTKRLPLNGVDKETGKYLAWLCAQKHKLNINSHSTVQAARGDHIGLTPTFGPSYDHNKVDEYRAIQKDFRLMNILIKELSDWMTK